MNESVSTGATLRQRQSPEFRASALSFFAEQVVEQATWVTMILFAYKQSGTKTAGLFMSVVLILAAVAAPLLVRRLERFAPFNAACVLFVLVAAIAAGTAALVVAGAPTVVVWGGLGLIVCCQASSPAVMFGLLPSTARDTGSLAKQHALMGWAESGALVTGPFVAAAVLGQTTVRNGLTIVLAGGAVVLMGAFAILGRYRERGTPHIDPEDLAASRPNDVSERDLLRFPSLRTLMITTLGAFLTIGALDVLFVPVAEAAGFGERRAGLLASAYGVGALFAYLGLRLIVGRRRLVAPLCVVGLLGSASLIGLTITEGRPALAVVFAALAGAGRSTFIALNRVLIQRSAPAGSLLRVGALTQAVVNVGYSAGVLVPWLAGTTARACVATGSLLPAALLAGWRGLRRVDDAADVPVTEIALLRNVAVLRSLQPELLESLARRSAMQAYRNMPIVAEGDVGREWFVIVDGTVEVTQAGRFIRSMSRGDVFGEIALVRGGPRSATVTAQGEVKVLAVSGDDFLSLIGRHDRVSQAVDTLILGRP